MYLASRPYSLTGSVDSEVVFVQDIVGWIFVWLRDLILPYLQNIGQWAQQTLTWQNMIQFLHMVFEQWPLYAFNGAKWVFLTHTDIVNVVSLCIFIGPIVILIPLLLIHELVIALLYNLSFLCHGFLKGTTEDQYIYLHSIFDDMKGSIFSSVDRLSARYNQWTTDYWPLAMFRLLCLALGVFTFYWMV